MIYIGLDVILPENHLVKISYVHEYMIITSIVELINENEKGTIDYYWFSLDNLPIEEYVPEIKDLIPKANILRNMYNKI